MRIRRNSPSARWRPPRSLLAEQDPDDETGGAAPISRHQRRALRLALTQKGIRETPPGSNVNIYSKYFGFGAQFWCADFVAWSLDKTGNQDRKVPWGYPSAVENITRWGKRNGKIHSRPQKGDIFTRRDGKHTGWVVSSQWHELHDNQRQHRRPGREGHLRGLARPGLLERNVLLRPTPLGVAPWGVCSPRAGSRSRSSPSA